MNDIANAVRKEIEMSATEEKIRYGIGAAAARSRNLCAP